ncbi:MAG: hypothetical protein QM777_08970 [Pseudorhodoferax sp.]
MKKTIAMFLLCASASLASADVLWGKARAGDSLSDVQAAYPGGRVLPPSEDRTLKTGAVQRYVLPGVDVGSDQFDASFYFKDEALSQVTLKQETPNGLLRCDGKFEELELALRSKYGRELHADRVGKTRDSTFVSGRTAIQLNMFAFDGCMILIVYNNRISSTADKL